MLDIVRVAPSRTPLYFERPPLGVSSWVVADVADPTDAKGRRDLAASDGSRGRDVLG